jgi:hypothetical protein
MSTSNLVGDHEHYLRRLSDKIQAAFEHACEDDQLVVASELLDTFEMVLRRTPPRTEQRGCVVGALAACRARLWHLRQAPRRETLQ